MKRSTSERIAIALAALAALTFTSCGKSGNGSPLNSGTGAAGAGAAGGCIPLPQPGLSSAPAVVGFAGTGVYFDSAGLVGGILPYAPQQPLGQMYVTTGAAGGPFQGTSTYGSIISMNISSPTLNNTGTNSQTGSTSLQGYMQISPTDLQDIYQNQQVGGGYNSYGYGTPYQTVSTVCVSGIAINLTHYNNMLYLGNAYLYLNNTAHGYILHF